MLKVIDQSWKDWIKLNIDRGCDKSGIFKILLEHKFHPIAIFMAMGYVEQLPEFLKENDLKIKRHSAQLQPAVYKHIDGVVLPGAHRLNSDKIHIYQIENFLSVYECNELIRHIHSNFKPSTTTNPNHPDKYFRTNQSSNLFESPNEFIKNIDLRIAEYMGIEPARSEGIQGQYYRMGEEFKTHSDYFDPDSSIFDEYAGKLGQRTWTFMIYLSDVEEGGETIFTETDITIHPSRGRAVVWNNLLPNGSINTNTLHRAMPIINGEKFIITKWFRTYGELSSFFTPFPYKQLPVFSVEGFHKARLPYNLFKQIKNFYKLNRDNSQAEVLDSYLSSETNQTPSYMIQLSEELRNQISDVIGPLLEHWIKIPLKKTAVYGIRQYRRGAVLKTHVDRIDTHIVSAIINVDQQVDSDWALHILDHQGRNHRVIMQPGDMLFYESARLQHGRPQPLQGESFANIFVHFMPAPKDGVDNNL